MPVASTRLSTRLIPPSSSPTSCGKMRQLAWTLVYFASPFILRLHAFQIVVTSCRGSEIHQVFSIIQPVLLVRILLVVHYLFARLCSFTWQTFFFLHPAFACQSSASSAPLTDTPVWTSSYQVNFGCAVVDAVSDSCARVRFWVLAITVESGHDGLRRQERRWWKGKRGCTNWENKKKGTL